MPQRLQRTIQRIVVILQVVGTINFQPRNPHTSPLFQQSSTLKCQDKFCLENILFIKSLIYHRQFLIHG